MLLISVTRVHSEKLEDCSMGLWLFVHTCFPRIIDAKFSRDNDQRNHPLISPFTTERITLLDNFDVIMRMVSCCFSNGSYVSSLLWNSLVQFSPSVMSDSLWLRGLQHTRLPCPSPTPGACSNSYPSSRWCHPTILISVIPFFCLQSFPASGSFSMSQLFAWSGQNTGVSALASVLPMNNRTDLL